MTALTATHLTKIIGTRTIVDDVSFELRPGEVFGFLGPNGAGKTTTIRMLVGLIKPTHGSVSVCGFDLRKDFEQAMRCRCLLQRQAPVNHRLHASQGHEAYERLHVLRTPPAYAHDAEGPHKDLP